MRTDRISPSEQDLIDRHRDQDLRQVASDIQAVLSMPEGRRLFMAMVLQSGVYTHTRREDNLPYLAGRRDAALELMSDANDAAAELVLKARQERHDLISERNRQLRELKHKEAKNGTNA